MLNNNNKQAHPKQSKSEIEGLPSGGAPNAVFSKAINRKRLLYLSQRRGMRELDLILGPFAEQHLPIFTDAETTAYEQLLNYTEIDLYRWLVQHHPVEDTIPQPIKEIIEKIR